MNTFCLCLRCVQTNTHMYARTKSCFQEIFFPVKIRNRSTTFRKTYSLICCFKSALDIVCLLLCSATQISFCAKHGNIARYTLDIVSVVRCFYCGPCSNVLVSKPLSIVHKGITLLVFQSKPIHTSFRAPIICYRFHPPFAFGLQHPCFWPRIKTRFSVLQV